MTTKLDYEQVIKHSYSEADEALRVLPVTGISGSDSITIAGISTSDSLNVKQTYSILDSVDTLFSDIQAATGSLTVVVTSLSDECVKILPYETTGSKIGLYTGPASGESLLFIIGPGQDNPVDCQIDSGTRITIRSMEDSAPEAGSLILTFNGRS